MHAAVAQSEINSIVFMMKQEPHVGACNDKTDCSNNGECVNNNCVCNPGFDHKHHPKDCSSKLEENTSPIWLILAALKIFVNFLHLNDLHLTSFQNTNVQRKIFVVDMENVRMIAGVYVDLAGLQNKIVQVIHSSKQIL